MEYLEKAITLISQVTGSISSWEAIITNVISFVVAIFSRNTIKFFYDKLENMNNPIITIATYGFLFSVYVIVYKIISAGFKARKTKQERLLKEQATLKYLYNLSRSEIAVLKFILKQSSCAAWLPENHTSVILLKQKGIIRLFSTNTKEISRSSIYYTETFTYARIFTVPDNVQRLITQIPQAISKKWKKIKPDHTFEVFQ